MEAKTKEEIIKEEMGKSTNITLSQMICSAMDEYANQLKEENARLREVLERLLNMQLSTDAQITIRDLDYKDEVSEAIEALLPTPPIKNKGGVML